MFEKIASQVRELRKNQPLRKFKPGSLKIACIGNCVVNKLSYFLRSKGNADSLFFSNLTNWGNYHRESFLERGHEADIIVALMARRGRLHNSRRRSHPRIRPEDRLRPPRLDRRPGLAAVFWRRRKHQILGRWGDWPPHPRARGRRRRQGRDPGHVAHQSLGAVPKKPGLHPADRTRLRQDFRLHRGSPSRRTADELDRPPDWPSGP